jgi:hypothetical protein
MSSEGEMHEVLAAPTQTETPPVQGNQENHAQENKKNKKAVKFRQLSKRVQGVLNEALMEKTLNPEGWLCAHAGSNSKYPLKYEQLMARTGLTGPQIRVFMHNNARKGRRMAMEAGMLQL